MIKALLFLRGCTFRNRTVATIVRLRQPKYLASFLVGIAYFYFFFFRHAHFGSALAGAPLPVEPATAALAGGAILFVLVYVRTVIAWSSAATGARLPFSEAEIAFLFPAPLSRRALIQFNLLGTQVTILVSSVLLTVLFGRWSFLSGNVVTHAIGWWLILSFLTLSNQAMNFLASRAVESFGPRLRKRIPMLLVIGALLIARRLWASATPMADFNAGTFITGIFDYVAAWAEAGITHGVLLPFSWIIAPFVAPTPGSFVLALGPALALLAVCYAVVILLEVPFNEGSILHAGKRAQVRAARRSATPAATIRYKVRRSPFNLLPDGRPEFAFLWKNLISIQSWFNLRLALFVLMMIMMVSFGGIGRTAAANGPAVVILVISIISAFYIMLLGPQLIRHDLRNDLPNSDVLKSYPLSGWQVVTGEILTPAVILSLLLWVAVLAGGWAAFSGIRAASAWAMTDRVVVMVCAGLAVPPIVILQLIVPNAAALLFPAWHQIARSRTGGIEAVGQRLIFTFGQFLTVLIALLPAIIYPVLVFAATAWFLGIAGAAILATVGVIAIVGGEIAVGLWWLGTLYDKLDIATELR